MDPAFGFMMCCKHPTVSRWGVAAKAILKQHVAYQYGCC